MVLGHFCKSDFHTYQMARVGIRELLKRVQNKDKWYLGEYCLLYLTQECRGNWLCILKTDHAEVKYRDYTDNGYHITVIYTPSNCLLTTCSDEFKDAALINIKDINELVKFVFKTINRIPIIT
jgi:hypothetical protein